MGESWLETRWRLAVWFAKPVLLAAASFLNHHTPPFTDRPTLVFNGMLLVLASTSLAGTGVKSRAPMGFPSGLAGSTQFTTSLPVSRFRLFTVRVGIGLFEVSALTFSLGWLSWFLFPSARGGVTSSAMAEYLLSAIVFLTGPYFVSVLMGVFLDEPFSSVSAVWAISLLLWPARYLPARLNIFQVWDVACPLITHRLPWSQMAISASLAAILFLAAFRAVQTQEY